MSLPGIGFNINWVLRTITTLCIAAWASSPAAVQAGSLPTPHWSVPTRLTSDDGYADLSWGVSGQDSVSFFKLTERFQQDSTTHYVDHPTTRLHRLRPGQYEYRVQACTRDAAGYPACGGESDRLYLTVSEAAAAPPPASGGRKGSSGQPRNPSSMTPGRWHNVDRMGHGWSFYWKSRLALPGNDPLFGDAWDLVGLWYTYELRGGVYLPMFAELAFTQVNDQDAVGSVLVTRNGQQENIGSVTITFQSDSQAFLDWEASFLSEYIAGEDPIELLVAPDNDPVDNLSHYSGLWDAPAPFQYRVSQGLGWISEAFEVVFEDEQGQPSWIIAEGDEPVPGHTDLCFYYVSEGVAPATSGDIVFYENGCDMDQVAGLDNRNGFRRFTGFEEQELWVNFTMPGGSAPGSFVTGHPFSPAVLSKAANFHRIWFDSASGPACELGAQMPACELELTWFTDGNYPDASVFVLDTQSGDREQVGSSPTMQDLYWSTSEAGSYRFELRMGALEDSSLMAFSETFEVAGTASGGANPEVPPQPAPAPDMAPSVASSSVGATSGEATVLPTGGAAYQLPILTAPGSGGLAPSVSLVYDSHSGNGPLGVGWSIDGFSVITRCAQTFEQDGIERSARISFTPEDRFCLNGERLMAISGDYGAHGTEYRKERDDQTRVISYGSGDNGPDYFRAWSRDGVLLEFGASTNARIETRAPEAPDVAFAWAQNRLEDTAGNYMLFSYNENQEGPVDFVLDKIRYTGNVNAGTQPYAELRFEYGTGRNDEQVAWTAGVASSQTRLLQRVDSLSRVTAGSSLEYLRSYQLDYDVDGWGRAVIESITECRDVSGVVCFEPTRFTWRKSEHEVSGTGPDVSSLFTSDFRGLAIGDVNGDGRPDLLVTEKNGSDFEFFVAIGEVSGSFTPQVQRFDLPTGDKPELPVKLTVIDLNADGYQDVLYIDENADDKEWIARLAGPDGLGEPFVVLEECCGLKSPDLLQVMDFNGDGLSDIMTHRPVREFEEASEIVVLINDFQPGEAAPTFREPLVIDVNFPDLFPASTPTGWEVADEAPVFGFHTTHYLPGRVDEFYGDGSVDILVKLSREYRRCLGPCVPLRGGQQDPPDPPVFQVPGPVEPGRAPDPGGDPTEEWGTVTFYLVFFADESGEYSTYEILARGAGNDCSVTDICSPHFTLPRARQVRASDVNADGLADAVFLTEEDWFYSLNTGSGFLPAERISSPLQDDRLEMARFIDLTGDGFPEMIYPNVLRSQHARWEVSFNNLGHGFATPQTSSMRYGYNDPENDIFEDISIFLDFSADGIVDQVFLDMRSDGGGSQPESSNVHLGINLITGNTGDAINTISQIENGFGAVTSFEYLPLTQADVYTRLNNSALANWGRGSAIYDLVVPFYVVSGLEQSAPTMANSGAASRRDFHYVGARLQAGGRGLLGFAEIVRWDPQKLLRLNTRYRQEYPFTGLEAESRMYLSNDTHSNDIISDISKNEPFSWPQVGPETTVSGVSAHGVLLRYVIREYSAALNYGLSGVWTVNQPAELARDYTLQGTFRSKIYRTREYDLFGNITHGEACHYEQDTSSEWSRISTSNSWLNDTGRWRLGRLTGASVEHWRAGSGSPVLRATTYGYDAQTSLLNQETTQPGDPQNQVVTLYELDEFGNREQTTVTGFGMAARNSWSRFDDLGRFATESRNAYQQVTYSVGEWDVFGNALEAFNIDLVQTLSAVDHMGRPFGSYRQDGSWNLTRMFAGGSAQCPAGTAYHARTQAAGGAESVSCHDLIGRKIRSAVRGFLGGWIYTDSYFDLSGQPERISEPYFAGEARYWNTTAYDALGRITETSAANGLVEEMRYDAQAIHCGHSGPGAALTITQPFDSPVRKQWSWSNVAGETEKLVDDDCGEMEHAYDAVGNLVETSGIDGAVITISYDDAGLKKVQMSDPDKGLWQYATNALGEVTRQLDSKDQAIDFEYDLLGRITDRRELRQVQSLADATFETVNHEVRHWRNSTAPGLMGRGQVYSEVYFEGENGAALHQRAFTFDALGRVIRIDHQLEGEEFTERATFDEHGRPFQSFDASGDSRGVRYHYNAFGHVEKLQESREGVDGVVYQFVEARDQRGNVTAATLGNQVEVYAEYAAASGFVESLEAYDANGQEMQFVEYEFDRLGNLLGRHDRSGSSNKLEEFRYDSLNRLEQVMLTAPELGLYDHVTQSMSYSSNGNIAYKLGVGTYSYGQGTAGPHAVTLAGGIAYSYDGNGNQTSSSDGRTIVYSVFDKATRISKGAEYTEFTYGLGNRRYKRMDNNSVDQLRTTLTVGTVEQIQEGSATPYFKRYIGGIVIADFNPASQQSDTWYLAKDHLGSGHSISNDEGLKVQEHHFGPWGMRQATDWQSPLSGSGLTVANDYSTKGFTGHEHADGLGVIHMNGRIYDPRLGRFLQADPFVQAPRNGQNLNRYSYALNNPLSYTDPSGYFFKRLIRKWGRTIIAAVAAYFTYGAASGWAASYVSASGAAAVGAAAASFVSVAIQTGNLRGAVKSAIVGGILGYVGHQIKVGYQQWKSGQGEVYHLVFDESSGKFLPTDLPEGVRPPLQHLTVNGMSTELNSAIEYGAIRLFGTDLRNYVDQSFTLYYNPTHGFLADLTEAFLGKLTNTSSLARQLAGILGQNPTALVHINAHSQGAIIVTNALRLIEGGTLPVSVELSMHGSAVSERLARRVSQRVGVSNVSYKANLLDFVPNVLGMNSLNPFRIIGSMLAFPSLFMGPRISPHSVYVP